MNNANYHISIIISDYKTNNAKKGCHSENKIETQLHFTFIATIPSTKYLFLSKIFAFSEDYIEKKIYITPSSLVLFQSKFSYNHLYNSQNT